MPKGRKIVVDANIAKSAGTTEAPLSKCCREALLAIRDNDHLLVMTETTVKEWDKHQTRFSRMWRTTMQQRGRICHIHPLGFFNLHNLISNSQPRTINRKALLKDFHIFASALSTDRLIVSNDTSLKRHLQKLGVHFAQVNKLIWASPEAEMQQCTSWIAAGAKNEASRYISR